MPESGSAVLEFIVVGVLLTMPVFYLVIALARLQAGAYAVTAAAREAGRTFVTAPDERSAAVRAAASARMAFEDQGFGPAGGVRVTCGQSPCLARGDRVETVADLSVELPLIPDFLRHVVPSSVHLSARHVATVDRFGAK
ncbi:pilus assembly protein [Leekyejoonella antrihumi]|uniref:Pilus assembly protein n=1 Tax=Leekyejoonella antrihumi TaxID=1660198 RepID=A0A563DYJ8_9MICO|nr:pilus assembly protein [Leekyejoonella antrihumi]TWP35297.1 pilus assembly protein [Leekyejoonella antrihumi]